MHNSFYYQIPLFARNMKKYRFQCSPTSPNYQYQFHKEFLRTLWASAIITFEMFWNGRKWYIKQFNRYYLLTHTTHFPHPHKGNKVRKHFISIFPNLGWQDQSSKHNFSFIFLTRVLWVNKINNNNKNL